jgi:Phosphotransferase enzyme family
MRGGSVAVERAGPTWSGLGPARPDHRELTEVVRAATGRPDAEVSRSWVEPVDYQVGSWATAELSRVRGVAVTAAESMPWSVFVKTLRSPHQLRLPDTLPAVPRERVQALAAADRTWRHEADVYRADLDDVLPVGMRFPARYRIDELGEDRIIEWLEDVPTADVRWDLARFERAATLLGRLAVRLTRTSRLPGSVTRVPGEVMRLQFLERELFSLPALSRDATWTHPLLAADRRLRADLHRLADRVPALLDTLDSLPQTFMHGDASPQNLLVPAEDPDTFVAIDWSLMGPAAVGYDLGQLLIGLAHAGQLDVDMLAVVHDTVLPAYTAGLAEEGMRVDADVVRFGFHAALVVRSAFSALPLARLAGPPTRNDAAGVAHRVRLSRHLVDLGLALPAAGP